MVMISQSVCELAARPSKFDPVILPLIKVLLGLKRQAGMFLFEYSRKLSKKFTKGRRKEIGKNVANCLLTKINDQNANIKKKKRAWHFDPSRTFIKGRI